MQICFLKKIVEPIQLRIDDQAHELVTSHKALGLVIQNNLKWNKHINAIVIKSSKRLHIIRVLSQADVEIEDLVTVYIAQIPCS